MFHKFDLGGVMHELWLAPTVNGYYLRILDGWSGPVAFAEESTGRGSLTVAGTSEAVAFAVDGDVIHIHMRGWLWLSLVRKMEHLSRTTHPNVSFARHRSSKPRASL